ncbi:hypothetical protein ATANTOWER_026137 [Ataeniobius toweri]|uniref:Uncharacterized protein n=1 Tax=Ataeniobius toweri TaxID=208326 RepID=A0ABU7CBS7_9TELE|nr:hypothetical protein [Ataeniobius toweri]
MRRGNEHERWTNLKQTVFQRIPCRDAVSTKPSGAVFPVWKEDNRDRITVVTCSLVGPTASRPHPNSFGG